jgi:hypothetical protein
MTKISYTEDLTDPIVAMSFTELEPDPNNAAKPRQPVPFGDLQGGGIR